MEDEPNWSRFVDNYQIAKVDEHNAIMLMNVLDFEAMETFMTTDEMKAGILNTAVKTRSTLCH